MSENSFSLGTVIEQAKQVITNPIKFYREMPTEGGYADPLIFAIVMAVAAGLLGSILSLIGLGGAGMSMAGGGAMAGGMAIGAIIILPIMVVIGSFIGAAILFVIWKLMGSEKDYETAYRCLAYTSAILPILIILAIIPYLATLVRVCWSAFLLFVASTEVHKIKPQTAKLVFGILAAVGLLIGIRGEYAARNISQNMRDMMGEINSNEVLQDLKNLQDMTPEEIGRKMAEYEKKAEAIKKGYEDANREDEDNN